MIRLIVLDIDGVITDGAERVGAEGPGAYKQVSFRDLDAIQEARAAGYELVLLTGEDDATVQRIARRVGIEGVYTGYKDKRKGLDVILEERKLRPEEVCFVGDSNRDARAFDACGLSFAPSDASTLARSNATVTLHAQGGRGAVAEAVEIVLRMRRLFP